MSKPPYAPYGDAVKLILVGSTTEPLSPEQRAIFGKMLARRMHIIKAGKETTKKKAGKKTTKKVAKQRLPNVCSNKHRDRKTGESETMYSVPDVFLYMVEALDEWGMMTPPLDLPYLRQMISKLDEPELPSKALRWLDLRRGLATLDRNPDGAPIGGETQSDLRLRLERELNKLSEQIKKAKIAGDNDLQDAANALAKKRKKEGVNKITKKAIAYALANSRDGKGMSEPTIERKIRKQW